MQTEDRLENATIWLHGDNLDPASVSERLSLAPADYWKKGDVHITHTGRKIIRKTGMWQLSASDKTTLATVQAHDLLRLLDGRGNLFQMFPALQFARLSLFVAIDHDERGEGDIDMSLGAPLIAMAASLGLEVDFSFSVCAP